MLLADPTSNLLCLPVCNPPYISHLSTPLYNNAAVTRLEYHVNHHQRHYSPCSETSASKWSRSWEADDWMFLLVALSMDSENCGIMRMGRELGTLLNVDLNLTSTVCDHRLRTRES